MTRPSEYLVATHRRPVLDGRPPYLRQARALSPQQTRRNSWRQAPSRSPGDPPHWRQAPSRPPGTCLASTRCGHAGRGSPAAERIYRRFGRHEPICAIVVVGNQRQVDHHMDDRGSGTLGAVGHQRRCQHGRRAVVTATPEVDDVPQLMPRPRRRLARPPSRESAGPGLSSNAQWAGWPWHPDVAWSPP